ncbi:MAG: NAD-dependent protein deacylase [Planctomycetota bacterium]|nr:MAG: NAD-dependent protein deacylase [Planctomycetota bacterium]
MKSIPQELVERLASVRSIGVITGAGISAESGIPTYRGAGGLYDDPEEGQRAIEALSGETLLKDPDRTWKVLRDIARHAQGAEPNPGHLALAEWEDRAERFALLTQNVDGLHHQAGSRNVIEIHGNIKRVNCLRCSYQEALPAKALLNLECAPKCPDCQGVLRPKAVLFGEMLPEEALRRLEEEFHRHVPDLLLLVGTTALFPYIAFPAQIARAAGSLVVEVNPEDTDVTYLAEFALRGTAGALLPPLLAAFGGVAQEKGQAQGPK